MDTLISRLREHRKLHLDQIRALCRIPSISTLEANKPDVRRAVEWTRDLCLKAGLTAQMFDTSRHPLVYAECCNAGAGAPTFLVYGHVDVQPTGDRKLWDADPFEPVVKGDWLVCRGSSDDKGQVLLYVQAAAAWLATEQRLPINLKFLIEGEEEIGSPNLPDFVRKQRDLLKCDGILISDTGLVKDAFPTITYGTRGLTYKEVRLSGPAHNLHSGSHGGAVANPANVLAALISTLHDADGRVNIPGFYDDVIDPPDAERKLAADVPFDENVYIGELGVPRLGGGERAYHPQERRSIRPTLDVNGIYGGFMDEGASTVIPARAGAKISMRLVPNQRGEDISRKFEQTIRARCPDTVRCEILDHSSADAYVAPLNWSAMKAAKRALQEAFGRAPVFLREGGSLPILPMFKQVLGADSLMLGFASPTCNAHGPNEKVSIADLDRGRESIARLFQYLAEMR